MHGGAVQCADIAGVGAGGDGDTGLRHAHQIVGHVRIERQRLAGEHPARQQPIRQARQLAEAGDGLGVSEAALARSSLAVAAADCELAAGMERARSTGSHSTGF